MSDKNQLKIVFTGKSVTTIIDKKDKIQFNAKEIATILYYENPDDAIKKHVEEKNKIHFEKIMYIYQK